MRHRINVHPFRVGPGLLVVLVACTPFGERADESETGPRESDASTGLPDPAESETGDVETPSVIEGCEEIRCDPSEDACADGKKCTPWTCGDASHPNSTACLPIRGDAKLGEACVHFGGRGSGTCGRGLYCWSNREAAGQPRPGTCVPLCRPERQGPGNCAELGRPDAHCFNLHGGATPVCLPTCDPLVPDECAPGSECYFDVNQFRCQYPLPWTEAELTPMRGGCSSGNECVPGASCLAFENSNCDWPQDCGTADSCGCCLPHCDLRIDDPDASCDLGAGEWCMGIGETWSQVPGHIGVCVTESRRSPVPSTREPDRR